MILHEIVKSQSKIKFKTLKKVLQLHEADVIFTLESPCESVKTKNNKSSLCKRRRRGTIQTSDNRL